MLDFTQIARPHATAVIAVTAPTRAGLLSDLEARLAGGQGFSIATLNLDHLVKFGKDGAFHDAYAAHSHVTADGNPIVWLCGQAGQTVELIPGSELVLPVAGLAAEAKRPIAMLGATDAALRGAAAHLQERFPGLEVAAQIAPPMGFDPDGPSADAAIETLAASGAAVCFLALGAPKQERFAARAQAALPGMGFLSIGAGLDFLAGTQSRAPRWVQRAKLEWLWRLASNPRRLAARYAACFAILPGALRHARRVGIEQA